MGVYDDSWQAPVLGADGKVRADTVPLTITGLMADAVKAEPAPAPMLGQDRDPIPPAPPGVSVDDNMRRARELQDTLSKGWSSDMPVDPSYGIMAAWFPKNHEMDYKQQDPRYQDFGNFNYGAVGSALGLGPYMLHGAAGVAQIMDKTWSAKLDLPFLSKQSGDTDQDYRQIDKGIAYERSHRPW